MSDTIKDSIIRDFASVINSWSRENMSNTPDFILAEYLYDCLESYEDINRKREKWYGKSLGIESTRIELSIND